MSSFEDICKFDDIQKSLVNASNISGERNSATLRWSRGRILIMILEQLS